VTHALYMDVHVPLAITRAPRRKRVDVLTAQDDGTSTLADDLLLDRAMELNRLLFTQDQDFLEETALRQAAGRSFATVIFARQAVSIGACVRDIEVILDALAESEASDLLLHLPL
jgi:predicted nuclease of predicted toxin-antitoxin system